MTDQTAIQRVNDYFDSPAARHRLADILGERGAGAYIASVLLAVANSDALQACTPKSIYTAALQAATLRLSVDPALGQAYLVPFKVQATLIVGYKGLHDLAVRTGKYRYINVGPVYQGETVEEDRISGLHHLGGDATSKDIIGWIAAFEMYAGYSHTMFMTVDEIHEHAQKYSKGYGNAKSLWQMDPAKMERKTVLRLLLRRWGTMDPTDAATLDEIEQTNDTIEGQIVDAPKLQSETTAPALPRRSESEIMEQIGFGMPDESEPAEEVAASPPPNGSKAKAARPLSPADLADNLNRKAITYGEREATEKQRALCALLLSHIFHEDIDRHAVQEYLFGASSLNYAADSTILAALDWLKPTRDSGGAYLPDPMACKEAQTVLSHVLTQQGQQVLGL